MEAGGGARVGQRALPHFWVTLQLELWAAPKNSLELDQTTEQNTWAASVPLEGFSCFIIEAVIYRIMDSRLDHKIILKGLP